jgi:ABC-type polar amino acid transport system ATPase subunit
MSDAPKIEVRGLSKSFGAVQVLDQVDLNVGAGEVLVIIGGSGAGKSTLLRCISLLEPFEHGAIHIDGQRLVAGTRERLDAPDSKLRKQLRGEIGMVFQQFNLFPHMTVLQNVTLAPRTVRGMSGADADRIGRETLARVGLADKVDEHPSRLSGGQQQRVAIARALAMAPQIMLFDEVTSALDPELVNEVLVVMREVAAQGMTMLVVTHEMGFARDVADRVIYMDGGRIIEVAPPAAMFAAPTQPRTQEFLRKLLHDG